MPVKHPGAARPDETFPLTVSIEEAGRMLGYSRDTAYSAARTGKLPTILIGKRKRRVPTHRLLELLDGRTSSSGEGSGRGLRPTVHSVPFRTAKPAATKRPGRRSAPTVYTSKQTKRSVMRCKTRAEE
jgi:hypothetical protein